MTMEKIYCSNCGAPNLRKMLNGEYKCEYCETIHSIETVPNLQLENMHGSDDMTKRTVFIQNDSKESIRIENMNAKHAASISTERKHQHDEKPHPIILMYLLFKIWWCSQFGGHRILVEVKLNKWLKEELQNRGFNASCNVDLEGPLSEIKW